MDFYILFKENVPAEKVEVYLKALAEKGYKDCDSRLFENHQVIYNNQAIPEKELDFLFTENETIGILLEDSNKHYAYDLHLENGLVTKGVSGNYQLYEKETFEEAKTEILRLMYDSDYFYCWKGSNVLLKDNGKITLMIHGSSGPSAFSFPEYADDVYERAFNGCIKMNKIIFSEKTKAIFERKPEVFKGYKIEIISK